MDEYDKHRKDCQFKFAPLDVCDCVKKNMADRIEALEAMVATAYEVSGDRAADEYDAQDLLSGANLAGYIRALTPTNARAALEARDKRVREDALREAALICNQSYGGSIGDGHKAIIALIDRTAEGEA